MNEHTPEPWFTTRTSRYVRKSDGLNMPAWNICEMNLESTNAEADARLIAAAPELLAVVKAYEAWETDLITNNESWDDHACPRLTQEQVNDLVRIQGLRNAAIAKARGEA